MKKKDIDIFGILLGVVIGCILGFFLSTRINLSPTPKEDDTAKVAAEIGNVYLLQIGKFDNPTSALALCNELKKDDLSAIVVTSGINYYVYGAITKTETELLVFKDEYNAKGYPVIIKKEYLLDKANAVIEKAKEYKFYSDAIDALMKNLENLTFEIDDEHYDKPVNLELLTLIISLRTINKPKLLNEIRLSIYEIIAETLV